MKEIHVVFWQQKLPGWLGGGGDPEAAECWQEGTPDASEDCPAPSLDDFTFSNLLFENALVRFTGDQIGRSFGSKSHKKYNHPRNK